MGLKFKNKCHTNTHTHTHTHTPLACAPISHAGNQIYTKRGAPYKDETGTRSTHLPETQRSTATSHKLLLVFGSGKPASLRLTSRNEDSGRDEHRICFTFTGLRCCELLADSHNSHGFAARAVMCWLRLWPGFVILS